MNSIILFLLIFMNIHPLNKTYVTENKQLSYRYYKKALRYFIKKKYDHSLTHIEKAIEYNDRSRRNRELLKKLRAVGEEALTTGEALVLFNTELAQKYLNQANILLDQKDRRRNKLNKLFNYIDKLETSSTKSLSEDNSISEIK